ncbi:DUF4240 domain-containing protein [Dactylosporangium sp. NBC_01737]|uniref:DUF4240 domain-containing protein n=1 Tax=Dactylosporangium sp. NBC_01737 TaxID=2975959 RepID=UPI002E0D876C|nr:DUF4240 domain-containing protein [Dactylosporangium sp. NBC_01737]
MDIDRCWDIIEAARAEAAVDWKGLGEHDLDVALATALIARLAQLGADKIAEFEVLSSSLRSHLDRDDVYQAAFLLTHGCGDDGFSDFRAGIVGLGRHWYDLVLQDPDHLADHPAVRGIVTGDVDQHVLRMEAFQYATTDAYGQVTGDEDALYDHAARISAEVDDEPEPTPPSPPRRLPRLAAMFPEAQRTYDHFHPPTPPAP